MTKFAIRSATAPRRAVALGALAFAAPALPALASPTPDFACFDRATSARVSIHEARDGATVTRGAETLTLSGSANGASFAFSDGRYRFEGIGPEATLFDGDTVTARCFQTADSIKTRALYGKERFEWDAYNAPGQAWQTVRATPSPFGQKIASLPENTPVTILENTGQFLDGFFWFRIKYESGKQGYVWGALLCTDADVAELRATVRGC